MDRIEETVHVEIVKEIKETVYVKEESSVKNHNGESLTENALENDGPSYENVDLSLNIAIKRKPCNRPPQKPYRYIN